MPINPISRHSLSDVVAGKLAASMLNGTLKTGSQLPPERELMKQLDVSRSTLREALKVLADNHLIDARQGVGWFVLPIDQTNFARAHELAGARTREPPAHGIRGFRARSPPGRAACRSAPEKPLHIPNLHTDRLGTFDFISWWERKTCRRSQNPGRRRRCVGQ